MGKKRIFPIVHRNDILLYLYGILLFEQVVIPNIFMSILVLLVSSLFFAVLLEKAKKKKKNNHTSKFLLNPPGTEILYVNLQCVIFSD